MPRSLKLTAVLSRLFCIKNQISEFIKNDVSITYPFDLRYIYSFTLYSSSVTKGKGRKKLIPIQKRGTQIDVQFASLFYSTLSEVNRRIQLPVCFGKCRFFLPCRGPPLLNASIQKIRRLPMNRWKYISSKLYFLFPISTLKFFQKIFLNRNESFLFNCYTPQHGSRAGGECG